MHAVQGSAVTEPSSVGTAGGDFKGQRGRLAYASSSSNGELRTASHNCLTPCGRSHSLPSPGTCGGGGESRSVLSWQQHPASHLLEGRRAAHRHSTLIAVSLTMWEAHLKPGVACSGSGATVISFQGGACPWVRSKDPGPVQASLRVPEPSCRLTSCLSTSLCGYRGRDFRGGRVWAFLELPAEENPQEP